jgi:hypothetical protein
VHPHDTPPSSRPSSATSLPDGRPALPDGRRSLGRLGEELAAAHFERLGFGVIARNVRTRHGEIDLIAFDGATLVFADANGRYAIWGASAGVPRLVLGALRVIADYGRGADYDRST